jgi:hypothetical protein
MGEGVSQWLVSEFTLFGVHFQNWMPIALVIVVFCVAYQSIQGRGGQ